MGFVEVGRADADLASPKEFLRLNDPCFLFVRPKAIESGKRLSPNSHLSFSILCTLYTHSPYF